MKMFMCDSCSIFIGSNFIYFSVVFLLITTFFYKVQTRLDRHDSGFGENSNLSRAGSTDSIISVRGF